MGILNNQRNELFCQGIALRGLSGTQAYLSAGYTGSEAAAAVSANRLLKREAIKLRIAELKGEVLAKVVETAVEAREQRVREREQQTLEREQRVEIVEAAVEVAILERQDRIDRLSARCRALDEIIEARRRDPEMMAIAGGQTGLLVKCFRNMGRDGAKVEYVLDTGLLKELRATEQQLAQELGEWLTKTAVDIRDDIPTLEVPEDASIEDIRAAKAKMLEAMAAFKKPADPTRVQ